jgi:hypothetical protein
MPVKHSYAGRTFGQITLSNPVPGKTGYWTGTCSCGNAVEKRIDNLKRPGNHSCGKCYLPNHATGKLLEDRVRRLEAIIFSGSFLPVPAAVADRRPSLTPSVMSEVRGE